MARPQIVPIRANGLGVPRRIVEQHHTPAGDGFIPNNTGITTHPAIILALVPFQNHSSPGPGARNGEGLSGIVQLWLVGRLLRWRGKNEHQTGEYTLD